jgi:DNA-binding NarL/FixJ family response regulator
MGSPHRLLIIADDILVRTGLATLLSQQAECVVVGQIASETELSDAQALYRPDVIVWDWHAPTINVRDMGTPILVLLSDVNDALDVWNAGARGILRRDATAELLASAIAAIVEGLVVIDPTITEILFPLREPLPARPSEALTPRELEVLRLMAEGKSNKTIARELGISESTVKFHVNAILGKLGVQSRTEAVVHATRLGLILL